MTLAEFDELIEKAINENRYLEAFVLKSLYIESIITVLATAKQFHDKGYDGKSLSVAMEIEKDPEVKKLYEGYVGSRLSKNIKILRDTHFLKQEQADYLYTWKDQYRDETFHNLGELMLNRALTIKCRKGLEFSERFTQQAWFKQMEESFRKAEELVVFANKS